VAVESLAGRHVVPGDTASDGYKVTSLNTGSGGGGIVSDVFGMNRRYRRGVAIARNGRTIELQLPAPFNDSYGVIAPIGWIGDGRRR
jgi:hypothetical protein